MYDITFVPTEILKLSYPIDFSSVQLNFDVWLQFP